MTQPTGGIFFSEMLSLVAKHDGEIDQHFHASPRNALYTSPDIQNALLNVMGNIICSEIASAVKQSAYFSILADETKDLSKQEQMTQIH